MDSKTITPNKRGRKPKNAKKEETSTSQSTQTAQTAQTAQTTVNESVSVINEISTDMLPVKKKRGRKPKPKDDKDVKVPKKRGRKPKEIYKPIETHNTITNEEAVILHLNIKNTHSHLNVEDQFIKYNPQISIPTPYIPDDLISVYHLNNDEITEINKHSDNTNNSNSDMVHNEINNETDNCDLDIIPGIDISIESQTKGIVTNVTNNDVFERYNKKNIEYSESIVSDKNKSISIFTEFSEANKTHTWPSKTNIDCLWCCFSFLNSPSGIPIRKIQETYHMFGNFCSPSCAASYIFEMKYLNEAEKLASYSMLNFLYKDSIVEAIHFAPSKLCLKKFGGRLTIEQFRNIVSFKKKELNVIIPPMISIIPNVEETNISNNLDMITNSNLNASRISKTGEILRLKRTKPLPDSNNTLESCMNLKLL